jgi:hypothetical protein
MAIRPSLKFELTPDVNKMNNNTAALILATVFVSVVPESSSADIGPKPSAEIHLTLNGKNIPDPAFRATMLTCQKGGEQFPVAFRDLIPQLEIDDFDTARNCSWKPAFLVHGGECRDGVCHFGYFLPDRFRLAVYLPSENAVFKSIEVTRENFNSTFEGELLSGGSMVLNETTPFIKSDIVSNTKTFLIALLITLILELLVARIYVSRTKSRGKVLGSVLIANTISLPLVWFVFPLLVTGPLVILAGEIFAFVFEGYFIHWRNAEDISLKKSFVLSILMNLTSLILGGFIFAQIYFFYF